MGNACCAERPSIGEFDKQLERLRSTGTQYDDTEFPAGPESLIKNSNDDSQEIKDLKEQWKNIQWLRHDKIECLNKDGPATIFSGLIEPNDIKQGSLGDCYFLSSLSVTSEHP